MDQEIRRNDGRTTERVHGEDMQEIKEVGVGAEQMVEALRGYVSEQRRIAEDRRRNEKRDEEIWRRATRDE